MIAWDCNGEGTLHVIRMSCQGEVIFGARATTHLLGRHRTDPNYCISGRLLATRPWARASRAARAFVRRAAWRIHGARAAARRGARGASTCVRCVDLNFGFRNGASPHRKSPTTGLSCIEGFVLRSAEGVTTGVWSQKTRDAVIPTEGNTRRLQSKKKELYTQICHRMASTAKTKPIGRVRAAGYS